MTWTGTEAPLTSGDAGPAGPSGLDGWQPLAPGALGSFAARGADADVIDLPALPLTGPLADALAAARAALDDAATATHHLASTGPEQRLMAVRQLAAARHVTDAALLRLIASFDHDQVRALGAVSLTDLIITHTGAGPSRAATEARLAAALTAPPVAPTPDGADAAGATTPAPAATSDVALGLVGAAHAAGRISTDVAALAQRTVADLPARVRRTDGPAADALLADALADLTVPQAAQVCAILLHTLDPDRADRGFDPDDLERRRASLTVHPDGWVDVHARLDPVAGAAVKAALDHAAKPDPGVAAPTVPDQAGTVPDASAAPANTDDTDDTDDADEVPWSLPTTVPVRDPRSAPQRRADALAALIAAGATETATPGSTSAHVIVATTEDALRGDPDAPPAQCETTGRPLTRAQLMTIACCAALHAVRLSCDGADAAALSLGRTVRLFTATQRRAMLARDGGCAITGCTAPPAWLEAHHVHDWAHGGPTDVDSGVLLCTRHHMLVTFGVWEVRMVDGVPQVRPPRTVDPLRRWQTNPRRALRADTRRRADRLFGRTSPPPGGPPEPPGPPGGA